jgi:hypothetical protein
MNPVLDQPIATLEAQNKSSENAQNCSFYGRSFKGLRVLGSFFLSLVNSIAYRILSGINWLVQREPACQKYRELADYCWNFGFEKLLTYSLFGDKVINFSSNRPENPRMFIYDQENKPKALKDIYGDLLKAMLEKAYSPRFAIQEENVSPVSLANGMCLGESLDFIGRFMKEPKNEGGWFKNIENLSHEFENGGSKEAEITQMLMSAQDTSQLCENKQTNRRGFRAELDKKVEDQQNKIKTQVKEIKAKYKQMARDIKTSDGEISFSKAEELKKQLKEELAGVEKEVEEKVKELKDKLGREVDFYEAFLDGQRLNPLAALHGVQLNLKSVLIDDDIKESEPPQTFIDRVEETPLGIYLILLSCSEDALAGHAVVFIKESYEGGYLFDPNFATLRFDNKKEQTEELWKLIKTFYNKKGRCSVQFHSCITV